MESAILMALQIAGTVVPLITNSDTVASVIKDLQTLAPIIAKEVPAVIGQVKSIIDALRGNAATTPEQLAQLDAIEAQIDADYDQASAAAAAEDATASAAKG